jgi:hypothetical protein
VKNLIEVQKKYNFFKNIIQSDVYDLKSHENNCLKIWKISQLLPHLRNVAATRTTLSGTGTRGVQGSGEAGVSFPKPYLSILSFACCVIL